MNAHVLQLEDRAAAQTPRALGAGGARRWARADIDPAACIVALGAAERAEAATVARALRAAPLPVLLHTPEALDMPRLRAVMGRVKRLLDSGPGVAVVDRLALDDLDTQEATALHWCLGQLIGRPVAQKWDGTMLYDVTDKGAAYGYGVRGSCTRVELVFHTDNAFGVAPPDYVGLLCLRPALAGGVSRFCSLIELHDRLLADAPDLVARLYRPMLWDRQAEHAPDAPKVARAPMFVCETGRLRVRANPSLVRKGYEVAGKIIEPLLDEALAAFQALSEDPALWFELPLERGQLQFLDNVDIAHYRSAFSDHLEPACKRHLLRTWHRERGRRSYDG